ADTRKLRRQAVGKGGEAQGDHRDDDAGDQAIFQRGHGAAVELKVQPGLRVLNHDETPTMHFAQVRLPGVCSTEQAQWGIITAEVTEGFHRWKINQLMNFSPETGLCPSR